MTTLLNVNASSISNTLATQTQATTVVSGHRSNKISNTNQSHTRKGTKDSCSRSLASNVCLTRGSHDYTTNSTSKLSAGPAVKVPYALSLARKVPPVACGKTKVGVSPPTTEYGCPRMAPSTTPTRPDAPNVFLGALR